MNADKGEMNYLHAAYGFIGVFGAIGGCSF